MDGRTLIEAIFLALVLLGCLITIAILSSKNNKCETFNAVAIQGYCIKRTAIVEP
jgi:hypothetical protein